MTAVDGTSLIWRSDLDDTAIAEVRALLDAATDADHIAPVSERALLTAHATNDAVGHLLARDGRGELLGYAVLDAKDPAEAVGELAVHPEHRRHGVGTTLVNALIERSAGAKLRIWAHGEHPGALRLAERLGFRPVRALWQLRRSLVSPELPEAEFPDGVRLRTFVVGQDEAEFLRVNNAAFAWHPEQGGWGIEEIKLREAKPWFDPNGFLLAVSDAASDKDDTRDRLLGFHWTKEHTRSERIGEVYVLGVDPAERGRKLGAALTIAGLRHLRAQNHKHVMLYVESDNHAAVGVYHRLGFTLSHIDAAFQRES